MREGTERLLEIPHSLTVGRPRHSLLPRLPAIRQGLLPHLAPRGMVRQTFHLLGYPVSGKRFKGLHDSRMEHPTLLQQEAAIGYLVREGVLESVLVLGEQARLVEKFSSLEMRQ